MNDLTRCLYDFVQEHRMGEVHMDPEYVEACRGVELERKKIQQALGDDEAMQTELRLLLSSISALSSIESEHLFQVALRLSRELDRVGAE